MKLLLLGGTKFLGRHLVDAALARNHQVTLFNRGQTNPELFPELEKLRGNRAGDLQALSGRTWDAAIDTCGFNSRKVGDTAKLLADSVKHYIFVSSISVYQDFAALGLDESAPVLQLPNGTSEDEEDGETYGARKAMCEHAVEAAMPDRASSVRAGMLVGPYDESGRFLYWVRRMARGGEVLAPGDPDWPVQLIDVRDLAEWIIRLAESGTVGTYNATGPPLTMTFQAMLDTCKTASKSDVRLTWASNEFLLAQGVAPFRDLPFWLPFSSHKGFFTVNCRKAFESGLTCRGLLDTARDTLAWDFTAGRQSQCGLELAREQELLETWKKQMP